MKSRDDPIQNEHVALNCCLFQNVESLKLVVLQMHPQDSLKTARGSDSTTMVLGSALVIPPIRLESPCHLDSGSQLNGPDYLACYPRFCCCCNQFSSESPLILPRRLGEKSWTTENRRMLMSCP